MDNGALVLGILIKYIFLGTAVAIAASILPKTKIKSNEIISLGLTAGVIFLMLDIYAPSIALGARQGAGFGIGSQLVGGIGIEGMHGNASDHNDHSCRDKRLSNMQKETVSRELYRLKFTGGVMNDPPTLDSDYYSYGYMGPEQLNVGTGFNGINGNGLSSCGNVAAEQIKNPKVKGYNGNDNGLDAGTIEAFSEDFKERRMKRLNQIGRAGSARQALQELSN